MALSLPHNGAGEGSLFLFFPLNPPKRDCGGLIIPSLSRDHSPREALMAPTECCAKRNVEHTPWISFDFISRTLFFH